MPTKVAFVSAFVALMLPAAAFAADVQGEIVTAATHAQLAANAGDLEMVHMHLHHTVNCLVGPKGADFDPTNLNPCAGSGSGAIPDSSDPAKIQALDNALAVAEAGIVSPDITTAKTDATNVYNQLQAVK